MNMANPHKLNKAQRTLYNVCEGFVRDLIKSQKRSFIPYNSKIVLLIPELYVSIY